MIPMDIFSLYMYLYDLILYQPTLESKSALKNIWQAPNKNFGSSKSWLVEVIVQIVRRRKNRIDFEMFS